MTQTICVPEGEAGDEAVKRLIPQIYRMASAQQRQNRASSDE